MKIIIMTDLEGVAGVVSFAAQAAGSGKYYDAAKELLTGEVNAAVDGLVESGVQDVLVFDGHGCGAIVYEELHERARLLHGITTQAVWSQAIRDFDACMMVGQHAMAGTERGCLNHTQSSQHYDYYKLNGKPIGEIAQFALHQGAFGQPMIFLSGDDAACAEAAELAPGITTAAVKQGLARQSAISLSVGEARRRIQEGVKQAVARHHKKPIAPLVWKGPFVLEKRFFHTDAADGAASGPGVERVDNQTIRIRGENILDVIYR